MSATVPMVEDHEGVRRSLRDWLQAEFPQYRMIEASTSEEAVTIAQATSPRVVLMDTVPSQMDGIEAVRQVKVSVPTAKVVVLAIHDAEACRVDAVAAGASAYIPRRVMDAELIPTLARLLTNDQNENLVSMRNSLTEECRALGLSTSIQVGYRFPKGLGLSASPTIWSSPTAVGWKSRAHRARESTSSSGCP